MCSSGQNPCPNLVNYVTLARMADFYLVRYPLHGILLAWIILFNLNNYQLGGEETLLFTLLIAPTLVVILFLSSLWPTVTWGAGQPLVVEFVYHRF